MSKEKNIIKNSRFLRVLFARKSVVVCTVIIVAMVLLSVFADYTAPYGYNDQDYYHVMTDPSAQNILGTDNLGRDILSRLIYGGRISFAVGLLSVAIAAVVGITLGLIAGMSNGFVGVVIMRFMDAITSVPMIILSLFISAILGKRLFNMCLAIGLSLVPPFCRTTRAQVLTVRESDYITAGTLCGASNTVNAIRHVLPNCISLNIVIMSMNIGSAIMCESSLSYLGMGINPPIPSWGAMVNDGYIYLGSKPMMAIVPGVCIMVVVLCCNIIGDAVRDALDPKLRGTLGNVRRRNAEKNARKDESAAKAVLN